MTMSKTALNRAAILALASTGAVAQTQPATLDGAQLPLVRMEVVGSRLPRLDAETALPVQLIRREAIERSGVQSVEELLQQISANVGGQTLAMGIGNGGTPGFSGASLRGLGSDQTLVLLNGRRLANYAFTGIGGAAVDLNAIPLAAIDRVEILKDGASALYGADAIAGVINFVTRPDYAGADASLAHAVPSAGGGERARASLGVGLGRLESEGFNALLVLDLKMSWRLRAVDRPFASTAYRPELGIDSTSSASFPANIVQQVGSRRQLVNPAAPACDALNVNKGRACWFDYAKVVDLVPPSEQANLLGRTTLRVTPESDAYAELSAAWTQTLFSASPSPVNQRFTRNNTPFNLPTSSPYYPAELGLSGSLPLSFRTVELGPRKTEVTSTNQRVLTGLRSHVLGWDVDSAVSLADSRSTERYVSGMVDAQAMSDAIATGLVNPFGPQDASGLALLKGSELTGVSRRARGRTQSADLRAVRELPGLPAGAIGLAAGVELRHEDLRDEQTALLDGDVVGGGASAPKQGRRKVLAGYTELLAPLTPWLELQAAARVDRYSDFGRSLNPKLALRLHPTREWLARASIGRGFRAPSLPELYTRQTESVGQFLNEPDPARCPVTGLESDCQPTVILVDGGSPRLKPQTSTQAGLGIVAQPAVGWQASLDLWSIQVHNIIGSLAIGDVVADYTRYEGRNVIRGPVDPLYPTLPGPVVKIVTVNENLGDWQVDGADLSLSMAPRQTGVGRIGARLDGTWTRRAHQRIFIGNDVDLIGRTVPRWKHALTVTGDQGPYSATLTNVFRRGYVDQKSLPDGSLRRVPNLSTWDLQLAARLTRDLQLSLGARNVFDRPPPASNQTSQFQQGYDPIYADPLGRTWTARLQAGWR